MPVTLPDAFPLLMASARRADRVEDAIDALRQGLAVSAIRKTVYDDAKTVLGNAFREAWDKTVGEPFLWAGKYENLPAGVHDLSWAINTSSLHDCLAAKKKLDKSGLEGPAIDAMRAVIEEVHPLAEAARDLKQHIVKGRAPNPNPPAENPNKVTGTCSCCFRGIAVAGSGMAHHGYERPGDGRQTASCSGKRFPPLEVSTEGLEWFIEQHKEMLTKAETQLEAAPSLTSVSYLQLVPRDRRRWPNETERLEVVKGEPGWERRYGEYVRGIQVEIRQLTGNLAFLEEQLPKWKKPEVEEPASGDEPYAPSL